MWNRRRRTENSSSSVGMTQYTRAGPPKHMAPPLEMVSCGWWHYLRSEDVDYPTIILTQVTALMMSARVASGWVRRPRRLSKLSKG